MRTLGAILMIVFCLAAFEAYWDMNFSCNPEEAMNEKSFFAKQIENLAEYESSNKQ